MTYKGNPVPINIHNLGKVGVISDLPPEMLVPAAWTKAENVRFNKRGVEQMSGHKQVFGALAANPLFILNVPTPGQSYWLYATGDAVYAYDGATHTNITRTSGGYGAVSAQDWNGTLLGGIPILNDGVNVPQYWPEANVAVPLADLPAWPANTTAKRIVAFGSYLIALNLTVSGTQLQHTILWSHKADPGAVPTSWNYLDPTVDAGRLELTDTHGGELMTAVLLGNQLIIYKASAIHSLQFVGGTSIFSPSLLLSTTGLLARNAVTSFDNGTRQFAMTPTDCIVHNGTKAAASVADDRVKTEIFGNLDPDNYMTSFAFDNPTMKEVWLFYPTAGAETPNKAAIWNYKNNTWTFKTQNAVAADRGTISTSTADTWNEDDVTWSEMDDPWANTELEKVVVVDNEVAKAFQLDTSTLFDSTIPDCVIERTGIAFDSKDEAGEPRANYNSVKLATRIWLKTTGLGKFNVQLGSQMGDQEQLVWADPQEFDPASGKRYLDFTVTGVLLAVRFTSKSDTVWSLQGYTFEVSVLSDL